jgi:hypothetical protein
MAVGGSRTLKLTILGDVDELKKSLNTGVKDVDGFSGKIGDFSKKAGLAFAAAGAAAGAMAIKIGVDAVKAASDLGETISKVNVLFGDTAKDIEKFADGAASSLGQTKQQALDAAATFATFGRSAGLTGADLGKFSTDFVKLASDLASFNNTSPEQAINAIGSALRGEAEPLRAYGVLLDDASLKQSALSLGIITTTKEALTPQQKVLAAQALIYQQTGAAQGDFARTSDGLANKTRILTAQLENAKVTIGEALLPIVLELATFFSDNVIPIVEKVTQAFSSDPEALGGTLSMVVDQLKSFVIPIFLGVKSVFDKIKATIIENKDEFKSFFEVLKAAAPIIGAVIGKVFDIIGSAASIALNIFANVIGALKTLINTAIDLINIAIRGFNLLQTGKDIPLISKIGSTNTSGNFASGGTPGAISKGGSNSGGVLDGLINNTITAGTQSGASGSGATNRADLDGSMGGGFLGGTDSQNWARISEAAAKAAAGAGGFTDAQNAARLAAAAAPTINLTVNGAIDPIGTARTIVNILNNEASLSGTFDNLGGSRLVAAI